MKKYTKPAIFCIEIRAEERLAAAVCDHPGACEDFARDKAGNIIDLNGNGIADGWSIS